MLEQIVQKFRGVVLLLVVFALSAVFLLQFGGPQARGCSAKGATPAAKVVGHTITRSEFQAAYTLADGENYPEDMAKQYKLREMVMYGLIERDLLAQEARKVGFESNEDDVMKKIAEDGLLYRSMSVDSGAYLPPSGALRVNFEDSKGKFNKDNLRNFIQYRLRRSVREFARDQMLEVQAQHMRDAISASVAVGSDEVWDAYVREKEGVKLKYVRFSPVYYADRLEPTEAEIAAFISSNDKDVSAAYERDKHRYTALEKQVRARHILIKVDENADEATKQAARARAAALLARAKKGEDFAALAAQNSEDPGSAKKGGDLGYNPKGRMVKPFDDAQFALAPGQISDIVESNFGFHIIKVEAVREGDVPVAEAKHELAQKMLRDQRAGNAAKHGAEELMQKVKAGASLEDAVATLSSTAPALRGGASSPGAAPSGDAAPADPLAPQVHETRSFGRTDTAIAGPFDSTPLVKAGYDLTEEQPLGQAPMQLGDDWFVYRLESKTAANRADFNADEQARIENGLLRRKRVEAIKAYVHSLRDKAMADKDIFVDTTLLNNDKTAPGSVPDFDPDA